ncbi:MAG: hypothetical protein IJ738_05010 [Alphaproteobacteria bacterium]|nr:hypothetical protein [Alphaproteobacteria bacterium]
MATFTLTVVIIGLTCNVALLYLLSDIKKMAVWSLVGWGILAACLLSHNSEQYALPVLHTEKILNCPNPEGRMAMMAAFNITEEQLYAEPKSTEPMTPIETGVAMVVVLALGLTPILLNVVKDNDDATVKTVHREVFTMNIVASVLMLSLYFGLKLTILPFYNKMFGKARKDLPKITQQKLA